MLAYLIFVIFFTRTKFLENKIYTEKTRKLRQNTQKIANFLRYYGKIHSKLPIFRVKSVKIYTGQKKIYTNIFVAFVTNIRYAYGSSKLLLQLNFFTICSLSALARLLPSACFWFPSAHTAPETAKSVESSAQNLDKMEA